MTPERSRGTEAFAEGRLMAGRSLVERLPAEALAEVHAAIREGDTIDEITRRMRAQGGTCSRAAVGRYVKRKRAVLRRPAGDDDRGERMRPALGPARWRPLAPRPPPSRFVSPCLGVSRLV